MSLNDCMEVSLSHVLKKEGRVIRLPTQDASAAGKISDETSLGFSFLKSCWNTSFITVNIAEILSI